LCKATHLPFIILLTREESLRIQNGTLKTSRGQYFKYLSYVIFKRRFYAIGSFKDMKAQILDSLKNPPNFNIVNTFD